MRLTDPSKREWIRESKKHPSESRKIQDVVNQNLIRVEEASVSLIGNIAARVNFRL